jgi:hypothetical protein
MAPIDVREMNNAGVVVGCMTNGAGYSSPVIRAPDAAVEWLDPNLREGCATDINAQGDVIGYLEVGDGEFPIEPAERQYFLYRDGTFYEDVRDLLPEDWSDQLLGLHGINDHGQLVISWERANGQTGLSILTPSN